MSPNRHRRRSSPRQRTGPSTKDVSFACRRLSNHFLHDGCPQRLLLVVIGVARSAGACDARATAFGSRLTAMAVPTYFDLRHKDVTGHFRIRRRVTGLASRITSGMRGMIETRLGHERLRQLDRRDLPNRQGGRSLASDRMAIRAHSTLENIGRHLIGPLFGSPQNSRAPQRSGKPPAAPRRPRAKTYRCIHPKIAGCNDRRASA